MKPHLTKVSLALLSTVFLFGCQERGPGAVGPDGPQFDKADFGGPCPVERDIKGHCHGDDGDGGGDGPKKNLVDVIVTGGMKTDPRTQLIDLGRKGDVVKLRATADRSTKLPYFFLEIAMTETHNAAKRENNAVVIEEDGSIRYQDPAFTAPLCDPGSGSHSDRLTLFNKLIAPPVERVVLAFITTSALVEEEPGVFVGSSEASHVIQILADSDDVFRVVNGLTVSVTGDINTDDFTVTFSGGRIAVGFRTPHAPALDCDNLDAITFKVGEG